MLTEHDIITKGGALKAVRPTQLMEYLTEKSISKERVSIEISPAWLGRVKERLRTLQDLQSNWDSYGALPVDPRIGPVAEKLIEWFAIADVPPPDVFATPEGGVQIEWHIRGVDIEIDLSPFDNMICFEDLVEPAAWSRPATATNLQTVRKRLITQP